MSPYTSSVETCTSRMPACRAWSSSTWVPSTSVTMNSAGPRIERSTCDSAAKLTIASQPAAACCDRLGIGDVALVEVVLDAVEVRAVARVGELVEHDDLVARRGETAHEMRADEAGAAGDEDAHRETELAVTGRAAQAQPMRRRHSRRPSRQWGSSGAPFSERSTE